MQDIEDPRSKCPFFDKDKTLLPSPGNEAFNDEIRRATIVIATPEIDEFSGHGTFWVHSTGFKKLTGKPDLEIRDVPGIFVYPAMRIINELNSYRLEQIEEDGKPIIAGENIDWGEWSPLVVEKGAEWYGQNLLRLSSLITNIECCRDCNCEE